MFLELPQVCIAPSPAGSSVRCLLFVKCTTVRIPQLIVYFSAPAQSGTMEGWKSFRETLCSLTVGVPSNYCHPEIRGGLSSCVDSRTPATDTWSPGKRPERSLHRGIRQFPRKTRAPVNVGLDSSWHPRDVLERYHVPDPISAILGSLLEGARMSLGGHRTSMLDVLKAACDLVLSFVINQILNTILTVRKGVTSTQ